MIAISDLYVAVSRQLSQPQQIGTFIGFVYVV
jgi:hypothetical protein